MTTTIRPLQPLQPLRLFALLLLAAALWPSLASARRAPAVRTPPPAFTIVELDDGMTLVHVPREGARTASIRYAVGAGGFDDPEHKGGLAHLLEHLIFHGSYDIPEGELFEEARRQGAIVNAFTSSSWTIYALDAPKASFLPLMQLYVRMITNPALRLAALDREKEVVGAEHVYFSVKSLLWAFDQQVFPSANRGQTVIGTGPSRANITLDDLLAFYEKHYVPSNTVVVVTGDLPLGEVRHALERSVLQPPAPPGEKPGPPPIPNVPSSARILSWPTSILIAYDLEDTDAAVCRDLARLLDLRLMERVRIEEPLTSQASVLCHESRGARFLVGAAFSKTLAGSRVPELMKQVFVTARRVPPSARERRIVQSRFEAELALLSDDTGEIAMRFATEAAGYRGDLEERLAASFERPKLDWKRMRTALNRYIDEDHHVRLQLSPFEQD